MTVQRTFTVPAPVAAVWAVLSDPTRLASCLPDGRQVDSSGDGLAGKLVLRVGSQQVTYTGTVVPVEPQPEAMLLLQLAGTEARGDGEAAATVELRLSPVDSGCRVVIRVRGHASGRLAGFDRDAVQAAGGRLLERFGAALAEAAAAAAGPAGPAARPSGAAAGPSGAARPAVPPAADSAAAEPPPAADRLATVTSITEAVQWRSRPRRGLVAGVLTAAAAVLTLWWTHRRHR